ncbi:hypothetical protein DFH07DRAFT_761095, partial [Mycena maculata]
SQGSGSQLPSLSSILPVHVSPDPNETPIPVLPTTSHTRSLSDSENDPLSGSILSIASLDSYHTAYSVSAIPTTFATEGGSTIRSLYGNYTAPLVHRFSLLKPGAKPKSNGALSPTSSAGNGEVTGWNPLDLFFSSGLLVAKCDICMKRLRRKPVLQCDDCSLRAHVKCGESAPKNCALLPPGTHQSPLSVLSSPLSKVKQNAAAASSAGGKPSPLDDLRSVAAHAFPRP